MQLKDFSGILARDFAQVLAGQTRVAVAVSGGPDSVALCYLLDQWAAERGVEIHALHVDHGLRAESGDEVEKVRLALKGLHSIKYYPLKWDGKKPRSAIQEAARKARYGLMVEHCRAHDIAALFLAHHQDDQAETVLFRLAKGSGLDGLAGMQAVQDYDAVQLCRPLLGVPKDALIEVCTGAGLAYLNDPSNQSDDFARVRLRQSRGVLEEEGLSNKRLAVTAKRLGRARVALAELAEKAVKEGFIKKDTKCIVFKKEILYNWPEEIVLRVVMGAIEEIGTPNDYAPRMEKIEALVGDLIRNDKFRKRTLGGVVFERDDRSGLITLQAE